MRSLRRFGVLAAIAAAGVVGAMAAGRADPATPPAEPTQQGCAVAVGAARSLAAALPDDDLSRQFAERDLEQALVEAGNGEFDDCLEWAARASEEVRSHAHQLAPGESLKVRRADQ